MKAIDIIKRGVQETKTSDKTYSYDGKADFIEESPEIFRTSPRGANLRPRSKASQNNSYT